MHAINIITKKRDGVEISREEIEFFIQGYTREEIPDYQAAAWLMAVYLQGMTDREMHDLTLAMAHSGDVLDLKDIAPLVVDKHSTGGVGDKVSLWAAGRQDDRARAGLQRRDSGQTGIYSRLPHRLERSRTQGPTQ